MPLSNINARNHPNAIKPVPVAASETIARKERPQASSNTVVTLSAQARNMQRAEAIQKSSQEHIDRISDLTRSDTKALESMRADAQQEIKTQDSRHRTEQQIQKRIDTQA